MTHLEERKVFVGSLPDLTTNSEIVEQLEKFEPYIYVHEIFTFKNRSPKSDGSISAIVTLDSINERDALVNSYRSRGDRVHFKNKKNKENCFYLDYCFCQKDGSDKPDSDKKSECIKDENNKSLLEEPLCWDKTLKDTEIQKLRNTVNNLELILKEKCPQLFISVKELTTLNAECEILSKKLNKKLEEIQVGMNELNELQELVGKL